MHEALSEASLKRQRKNLSKAGGTGTRAREGCCGDQGKARTWAAREIDARASEAEEDGGEVMRKIPEYQKRKLTRAAHVLTLVLKRENCEAKAIFRDSAFGPQTSFIAQIVFKFQISLQQFGKHT